MFALVFLGTLAGSVSGGAEHSIDPTSFEENSRAGKKLCANPDHQAKSCSALSSYTLMTDGSYSGTTEYLMPDAPVVLILEGSVVVKGSKACGSLSRKNLDTISYRVNGQPASPEQFEAINPRIRSMFEPMIGRKVCDTLEVRDGLLLKRGVADGIKITLPPKPVAWVLESEGYTVAPIG